MNEISQQMGKQLDIIYINSNYDPTQKQYDVLAGPDQVYVWANCGVALLALPYYQKEGRQISFNKEAIKNSGSDVNGLKIIQPPLYHNQEIDTNTNALLVLEYFFPPTSYEGFKENYLFRIPFFDPGFWRNIVNDYNSMNK